jgi:predicted nucleotidyltransferase
MDKTAVIERLRRSQPELRSAGVVHLRLFGSVARGEDSLTSDIDLMADLDPAQKRTLLTMTRLQNMLSDLLGAPVDLSIAANMRSSIRERAQREAVLAF